MLRPYRLEPEGPYGTQWPFESIQQPFLLQRLVTKLHSRAKRSMGAEAVISLRRGPGSEAGSARTAVVARVTETSRARAIRDRRVMGSSFFRGERTKTAAVAAGVSEVGYSYCSLEIYLKSRKVRLKSRGGGL
jgi:hypothetical protein